MKSTLVVLLVILALSKSLEIFESSTPQPSCCHKCPDGLIKTYSIIEERGNCGESCN
jgi:hypothetical protein